MTTATVETTAATIPIPEYTNPVDRNVNSFGFSFPMYSTNNKICGLFQNFLALGSKVFRSI